MVNIETGLWEDDDGRLYLGSNALETICFGEYSTGCPGDECALCRGSGIKTTYEGDMLLEFIARHTKRDQSE